MTSLFKHLPGKAKNLRDKLAAPTGAARSLAIKTASVALLLISTSICARVLGPERFGIYTFAISWVLILSLPVQLGMPNLITRETARSKQNGDWGKMKGLWCLSAVIVGALSLAIIIPSTIYVFLSAQQNHGTSYWLYATTLALIPCLALQQMASAAVRGLGNSLASQLPEGIFRPAFLIALIATTIGFSDTLRPTPDSLLLLNLTSTMISTCLIMGILFIVWPIERLREYSNKYDIPAWRRSVLPLALISGMNLINQQADIVLLGMLKGSHDVGIYKVASQGALLIVFGLQALNMVVAPRIARLHEAEKKEELQHLVAVTARSSFYFAVPMFVTMVLFGRYAIAVIFGDQYLSSYLPLVILGCGQMMNALFGSVGFVLNMTGHEFHTMKVLILAAITNLILNVLLIPPFGIIGASASTATTLFIWNFMLYRAAKSRLAVESIAFARLR